MLPCLKYVHHCFGCPNGMSEPGGFSFEQKNCMFGRDTVTSCLAKQSVTECLELAKVQATARPKVKIRIWNHHLPYCDSTPQSELTVLTSHRFPAAGLPSAFTLRHIPIVMISHDHQSSISLSPRRDAYFVHSSCTLRVPRFKQPGERR